MSVDAVENEHIEGVVNITFFHERLESHYDFFNLCFCLVEFVFVEEEYFSLSFLFLELFVDFFLQAVGLLSQVFLRWVLLWIGRMLRLLKILLVLGLVSTGRIHFNHFTGITADHVG